MRIIYIPPFSEVYRHRFYQTKEMVEYSKTTSHIGQEEYSLSFAENIQHKRRQNIEGRIDAG